MNQIRLFIMCEFEGVRRGLSAIFSSDKSFDVLGVAGLHPETITDIQKFQPDAIICEIKSAEETAYTLEKIKEVCPYTKIFIFIDDDFDLVQSSLVAGADGCLSKTMLPCHLVKVVELTCRAGILCLPGSLKQLVNRNNNQLAITGNENKKSNNGQEDETTSKDKGNTKWKSNLTAREMEIYKLITQNYSNKEIGKALYISQPTVKSHVSSILRKLGINNRTQLIFYELQHKITENNHETTNNVFSK